MSTNERVRAAADAIRAAVRAADRPIVSAAAAQAALEVDPEIKNDDWLGAGGFRAFLVLYVDDLVYASRPAPGHVYDPSRHSNADIPGPEGVLRLDPLEQIVCASTGAPPLDSPHYAALFTALAEELHEAAFDRVETSKRTRNRTDLSEFSVSRNAVNFVINGLLYSGVVLTSAMTARDLALAWVANLENLCANATLPLSASEREAIARWVLGDLAESDPSG